MLSVAFLLTACASDTSTQEKTSSSCTEQWCQEHEEKTAAEIDNARNDEHRRNKMIKDNKHAIPGTYYPVHQEQTSRHPGKPQGINY
ncbi:hypothetical protein [Endozoicomonas arenosclerae]|uniref:hypothetical protein n=1 Tax=Endozoicomonas arenosclerae TaxID=1633495 RepID=UPI001560FBE1|nr:hypothetical protein [Endozoicomonas arenosclerae]